MKTRSIWIRFRQIRASRALFLGINLLLLLAAYFVFVEPFRRIISEGAQAIEERRQILARYEAVVVHEGQIQDYSRQVSDINANGELFDGDSDGVINANLQARLKTIAEMTQVTIRSIQMLPNKEFQGATLVGARIEVTGPNENVHALARALEGEPPLLLITAASVRSQTIFWGTPQGQQTDEIEAQFDVFGGAPKMSRR